MADVSKNALLQYGDAGGPPEAYLNLAAMVSISGPALSNEPIDVTDLDDAAVTRLGGVVDSGEVTLDVNYEPDGTGDALIISRFKDASANTYQVCWPNLDADTVNASGINTTTEVVTTVSDLGLVTGQPIKVATTGTLPTATPVLSADTVYYWRRDGTNTGSMHTTNAGAVADTGEVDFSDGGTGTFSITTCDVWNFEAIVSGAPPAASVGERLSANVTMTVTGSVTT